MIRLSVLFLLVFTTLILSSCKDKEDDATLAKVQILEPPSGSVYSVGETITVKASIYHDKIVTALTISLVNDHNIAMSTPVGLIPNQQSFEIEEDLLIDNPNLESGSYFIMVKVSDGSNDTRAFQPVDVNGIEPELKRILVVTQFNSLKSNISIIDSVYNVTQILGVAKPYMGSALSSKYNQFYYITPNPSRLMTYDLNDTVLDWEYSAQSPYPIFEDIYYADDLVYLASQNGNIVGLNQAGENKFGTVTHNDRVPQKIFKHENLIISDQRTRSNYFRYFTLFFSVTGAFANQHRSDLEVVKFFSRNEQEIIAFGNELDEAAVKVYEIESNNSYIPAGTLNGKILNAVQVNNNGVLLAMDYGVILYNLINFEHYLAFDHDHVNAMDYDPLNNLLYMSEDNKIFVYSYPGSALLHTVSMDYPVINLHLLYNK